MGVHKATGQARVVLSGVEHYCGRFGTVEAHARYLELLRLWREAGQQPIRPTCTAPQTMLTISGLFDAFLDSCDRSGRYHKNGEPTSNRHMFAWVRRSNAGAPNDPPVAKITVASLIQWRDTLEENPHRTRTGINRLAAAVQQVVRWGPQRGMVPKNVAADLLTLAPLRRGEVGARPERGRPRRATSF